MIKLTAKNLRIIKTCNLYIAFFTLGLCVALIGPCLLDLQHIVKTNNENIALIYTARSTGYVIGAVFGGILLDIMKSKHAILTACSAFAVGTMLGIPWSRSVGTLLGFMVVNGICLGSIETGGNVVCLTLWGKDSGPFFQGLHFTFGLGGLIAPLIAAPYLGDYSSETVTYTNNTHLNTTFPNSTCSSLTNGTDTADEIPKITYPFTIIGIFTFFVTILLLVVSIISPTEECRTDSKEKNNSKRSFKFMSAVVILNFLLIFVGTGTEIGYAQMLTTYSVKGRLKLAIIVGSYITSAFWASFTVFRLASVYLSVKFTNLTLILWDIVLIAVSACVLLFLMPHEWALWLASVIFGAGVANFYPAAIGWLDTHINVTNKIAAIFTVGAAAGEMVVPFIISYFIETIPEMFTYVVAASAVLSAVLVAFLYLFFKKADKIATSKGREIYVIRSSSVSITT